MTSTQEKTALLEEMGIPRWVSRTPAAVPLPAVEKPATESAQAGKAVGIKVSGNAVSGWLWLTEAAVDAKEMQLLTDIQQAVNCRDGGLLAYLNSKAAATLDSVIESELITRLVIFGSSELQDILAAESGQPAIAKVTTLALTELEKSPAAKRQLWSDLKQLVIN